MAHIGVQGFATRHRKNDCPHDGDGQSRVVDHETNPLNRAEGRQNGRVLNNLEQAKQSEGKKPGQHHRTKYLANRMGAVFFDGEKRSDQDD